MQFIEKIFQIAPDGGNGLTEAALFIAVGIILIALVVRPYLRRRKLR